MAQWNPPNDQDATAKTWEQEQRRIEAHASHDAFRDLERIWNSEIPNGDLWPIAAAYANNYIQRLLQESIAIPRQAFGSEHSMRLYLENIYYRYRKAFFDALTDYISTRMKQEGRVPPRTTPRLRSLPSQPSADDAPSESGPRRTRGA